MQATMKRLLVTRFGIALTMALGTATGVQAMGASDHDLARDMATHVYGVDYRGPVVAPCAAPGPTKRTDCAPPRGANPGNAAPPCDEVRRRSRPAECPPGADAR